jgi:hypothetical protein
MEETDLPEVPATLQMVLKTLYTDDLILSQE